MRRLRRACLWFFAVVVVLVVVFLATHPEALSGVYWEHHKHCIKFSGMALRQYADDHGGRFPYDSLGYPQALLLLDEECYHALTGPGYDATPLRRAKQEGTDLAEEECGRVYVQGLTIDSNHE